VHGERYSEAEQRYAEVIEKYPHSAYRPQAMYGLAFARFKLGRFGGATEALDQLDKLGPKADLAQEAELLRGQTLLALQKFEQASVVLVGIISKYPNTHPAFRASVWLASR
jgi:TolA-binding protein